MLSVLEAEKEHPKLQLQLLSPGGRGHTSKQSEPQNPYQREIPEFYTIEKHPSLGIIS